MELQKAKLGGKARFRLLAGLRIRRKLIVLHTLFSLVLAGILLLALRPAVARVVREAEAHEARVILAQVMRERAAPRGEAAGMASDASLTVRFGGPESVGIDQASAEHARQSGEIVEHAAPGGPVVAAAYEAGTGQFVGVSVELADARAAVRRMYVVLSIALLAVYGLVAVALEVFVLPQHVYRPIRTMLAADAALQSGRRDEEVIAPSHIPEDELGEIMRSRNESVRALRRNERELAAALANLEEVATDLKRKNHLLEMAKQNLADADRLASLGMMSAGIAHELNTPLTVIKGLAERVHAATARGTGAPLSPAESALMLRVVERLERLSESLLDFARVRPARMESVAVRRLVEEAWTLVGLDREASGVVAEVDVPEGLGALCDGDRIVQVLVNILRNAVDAMEGRGRIVVHATAAEREGGRWTVLTITDTGPGIDSETLGRLFQPFVSTKLDAKGTGLGLAVAEGIVREHGGVLLARNRTDGVKGAVFEIVLPHGTGVDAGRTGSIDSGSRGAETRV